MRLAIYQSLQSMLLSAMVCLLSLTTHKHLPQSCNEWHQLYGQAAKIYKWCRMAESLRASKSDDTSLSLSNFLSHSSELQLNRVFMNFKRYFFLIMTDNSISHTGYSHKAASIFSTNRCFLCSWYSEHFPLVKTSLAQSQRTCHLLPKTAVKNTQSLSCYLNCFCRMWKLWRIAFLFSQILWFLWNANEQIFVLSFWLTKPFRTRNRWRERHNGLICYLRAHKRFVIGVCY